MSSPMRWRGPAPAEAGPPSGDRRGLSARPALLVGLTGLALTLTGFAVAGPTVAVPGAALLILALLAPVWVLGLGTRVGVAARAPSRTVMEGQSLGLEIVVTGPRWLSLAGARVEHPLLEAPVVLRGAGRLEIDARARGRGRLRIGAPELTVSDPIGLARGTARARHSVGALLVLPRVEPVRWLGVGAVTSGTGVPAGLYAGPPSVDIAGLREYQPGTPATRIHWPAMARGGELLERVFATESERAPLVALDLRCGEPTGDPALVDQVVRATASLVLALAQGGSVELMLAGAAKPLTVTDSLSSWPATLAALALAPARPLSAPPPPLPAGEGGILFYACTDPALAGAARHRWAGSLVILAPAFSGERSPGEMPSGSPLSGGPGQAAVLEVAGCVGRPVWGGR
jgi:uncharacterized protein (DUF58 family)